MMRWPLFSLALLAQLLAILANASDPIGTLLQQSFIWPDWIPDPLNAQAYIAFRQNFTVSVAPSSALLHLFADSRYMLWINGAYVLRGPCRFNPKRPEYDTVDVTGLIVSGSNSLVALAHHYGAGVINGRIMSHAPGLTALLVSDGVTVLQTSPAWRCTNETEYGPSPGAWSSIPDNIDARAPVQGWTAPAYDDSSWGTAAPVNGSAWGALYPRAMPLVAETPLLLSDLTLLPAGTPLAASLPLTLSAGQSVVVNFGRMVMVYADLALDAPAAGAVLNLDYALRYVDGSPRETYGTGSTLTTRAGPQRLFGADQWCSHYMIISVQVGCPESRGKGGLRCAT
jgi:alpha-L-rhamnosidase